MFYVSLLCMLNFEFYTSELRILGTMLRHASEHLRNYSFKYEGLLLLITDNINIPSFAVIKSFIYIDIIVISKDIKRHKG